MSRLLKQAALVLVIVFTAAQFVRPQRTNPPTDASRTIQTHASTARGLVDIFERACNDCHSNATVWRWYSNVAPLSWAFAYGVKEGRNAVNFSEWSSYTPQQQRQLLMASCQDVSQGKMPGRLWTLLHPETRLSAQDVMTICAAAGKEKP